MQTVTKTANTIQPGDIFFTEYVDYENFCKFVFISCEPYGKSHTKINVRNITNNAIFSIYDLSPIDKVKFDVIGHTEVLINGSTNCNKQ